MPFSPIYLLLFIFLIVLILAFIQVGILTIAFGKLGLSPESAMLLLFTSLIGSTINLPLFKVRAEEPLTPIPKPLRTLLRYDRLKFEGYTTIAVNVGGCLVPICFSYYLAINNPIGLPTLILAILMVAAISFLASRPVPGLGIGIPVFVAPLSAALIALILNSEFSAQLAYISGTLGVLIGADILRLHTIRTMGTPVASIGGAGTFDGIFLTGIIAALLA